MAVPLACVEFGRGQLKTGAPDEVLSGLDVTLPPPIISRSLPLTSPRIFFFKAVGLPT